MHELDKYWTLSRHASELGVSIARVIRLIDRMELKTYRVGAAVLLERKHSTEMQKAIKEKLISAGRPQKNGR
jgi:hypothetical protein